MRRNQRALFMPPPRVPQGEQEVTRFDTLTKFVAHVEALPGQPGRHDGGWGGTYANAIKFATDGWPEGADKAATLATRIADRAVNSINSAEGREEIVYDVAGACYDPGALMAGVPEVWNRIEPIGLKREVKIALNTSLSGGINKEVMIRRGVAVCALALALQARGHAVTIDVGGHGEFWGAEGGRFRSVWVRVADAQSGSPLDIDRVVYACGYPAFFRLLIHHHFAGTKDALGGHLPTDTNADPGADLYLGCAHLDDVERWEDGGEAWIIEEFMRQTKEAG